MLFFNPSYLSLRQEEMYLLLFFGDHVAFQFTKFFKKIFKFIIQLIIDSLLCYTTFCEKMLDGICCNFFPSIRRPCDGLKKVNWIYNLRGRTIIGDSWEHVRHKLLSILYFKALDFSSIYGLQSWGVLFGRNTIICYCTPRLNFADAQLRYTGTRSQFYSLQSFGGWTTMRGPSINRNLKRHMPFYLSKAVCKFLTIPNSKLRCRVIPKRVNRLWSMVWRFLSLIFFLD